jgi:SH3-like domain-containing protein
MRRPLNRVSIRCSGDCDTSPKRKRGTRDDIPSLALRVSVWTIPLLLVLVAQAAATDFPYVAYISSDDVYIRSGPGKNYYPTAKLKRGEPVEIYRHDPGGWYAVRPPAQSFSWISARQIDVLDDGLAVVNTERAVARVGSLFSDVRDVIQVRLNKDERVELVDHRGSGEDKWCKITPPAGEFRWVYKDYVSNRPREDELADEEDANDDRPKRRARRHRDSDDEIRLTSGDRRDDAPVETARLDTAPKRLVRRGAASDDRKSFIKALSDVDLDLSAMVAEEITLWKFEDLRGRTERLIERAPTAIERGQGQAILAKIDRFDRLKARQEALLNAPAEVGAGRTASLQSPESVGQRFDATGRLAQVTPRKDGAAPFVLLDRRGNVVSYVTSTPNINLRPYIDRLVGINGQRGYMPDVQKPHITAQHITVLSDSTARR